MILSGTDVRHLLATDQWQAFRGHTKLTVDSLKFGPNSVDVTLHPKLLRYMVRSPTAMAVRVIQPGSRQDLALIETQGSEALVLKPGDFCLAAVQERFVATPFWVNGTQYYAVPMIEGRSTFARLGLAVHITAGFGDVGFDAPFTLELKNMATHAIALTPGMRIAQVYFQIVSTFFGPPEIYSGAYSQQSTIEGPVAPVTGPDRI